MFAKSRVAIAVVALSLLLSSASSAAMAASRTTSQAAPQATSDQDTEIRRVLIEIEQSIAAKDADKIAANFADGVIFIDQTGEETHGKNAFRDRFVQLFKTQDKTALSLHPDSITFPASNVAIVMGVITRQQDAQETPMTRFSLVLTKANEKWSINECTETFMQAAQTENHLQELSWLIGKWHVGKTNSSADLNVEWAPGKKFIISKITLNKQGEEPQVDSQVIGWDPQNNNIVSWHFDSNGGFGNGTWTKQPNENKWTVTVAGVGADGSNTKVSNVFSLKKEGEFVWQSVQRSMDGNAVEDSEPLTVERVKR